MARKVRRERAMFEQLLGLDRDLADRGAWHMAARTVAVYAFTLALVRFGSKRFMSRGTVFDVIVAIMLGSIVSRGINGEAPLWPSLAAGTVLMAMHWVLAALSAHYHVVGRLVKGDPILLIRDGQVLRDAMRKAGFSDNDLQEALRLHAGTTDPSRIERGYLERSGNFSLIRGDDEPTVVEVSVEAGVQRVRVEWARRPDRTP